MAPAKVVSLQPAQLTRAKLLRAAAKVLARRGFCGITHQEVCDTAGVMRTMLFAKFGGLTGLMRALAHDPEFWPQSRELIGKEEIFLRKLCPADLMAEFFHRFTRALLSRPHTLEVLAWENVQRTPLTKALEEGRERTALEFFELMEKDPPPGVDVTALVAVLAAALQWLAIRSRHTRYYGGLDLMSEQDWQRIDLAVRHVLRAALGEDRQNLT